MHMGRLICSKCFQITQDPKYNPDVNRDATLQCSIKQEDADLQIAQHDSVGPVLIKFKTSNA